MDEENLILAEATPVDQDRTNAELIELRRTIEQLKRHCSGNVFKRNEPHVFSNGFYYNCKSYLLIVLIFVILTIVYRKQNIFFLAFLSSSIILHLFFSMLNSQYLYYKQSDFLKILNKSVSDKYIYFTYHDTGVGGEIRELSGREIFNCYEQIFEERQKIIDLVKNSEKPIAVELYIDIELDDVKIQKYGPIKYYDKKYEILIQPNSFKFNHWTEFFLSLSVVGLLFFSYKQEPYDTIRIVKILKKDDVIFIRYYFYIFLKKIMIYKDKIFFFII